MGVAVWTAGSAMALYEVVAVLTGRRTVSRARGLWRVGIFGWVGLFAAHLAYEMVADDLAQRAAATFGTVDR